MLDIYTILSDLQVGKTKNAPGEVNRGRLIQNNFLSHFIELFPEFKPDIDSTVSNPSRQTRYVDINQISKESKSFILLQLYQNPMSSGAGVVLTSQNPIEDSSSVAEYLYPEARPASFNQHGVPGNIEVFGAEEAALHKETGNGKGETVGFQWQERQFLASTMLTPNVMEKIKAVIEAEPQQLKQNLGQAPNIPGPSMPVLVSQAAKAVDVSGREDAERAKVLDGIKPVSLNPNDSSLAGLLAQDKTKTNLPGGDTFREKSGLSESHLPVMDGQNVVREIIPAQPNVFRVIKTGEQLRSGPFSLRLEGFNSEDNSFWFSLHPAEELAGIRDKAADLSEHFSKENDPSHHPDKSALVSRTVLSELMKYPISRQAQAFTQQLQDSTLPMQAGKHFEENISRQMIGRSLVSLQQNLKETIASINSLDLGAISLELTPSPRPSPTRGEGNQPVYRQGSPPPLWGRIKVGGEKGNSYAIEFDLTGEKLQGRIFSDNQVDKEAVEEILGQLNEFSEDSNSLILLGFYQNLMSSGADVVLTSQNPIEDSSSPVLVSQAGEDSLSVVENKYPGARPASFNQHGVPGNIEVSGAGEAALLKETGNGKGEAFGFQGQERQFLASTMLTPNVLEKIKAVIEAAPQQLKQNLGQAPNRPGPSMPALVSQAGEDSSSVVENKYPGARPASFNQHGVPGNIEVSGAGEAVLLKETGNGKGEAFGFQGQERPFLASTMLTPNVMENIKAVIEAEPQQLKQNLGQAPNIPGPSMPALVSQAAKAVEVSGREDAERAKVLDGIKLISLNPDDSLLEGLLAQDKTKAKLPIGDTFREKSGLSESHLPVTDGQNEAREVIPAQPNVFQGIKTGEQVRSGPFSLRLEGFNSEGNSFWFSLHPAEELGGIREKAADISEHFNKENDPSHHPDKSALISRTVLSELMKYPISRQAQAFTQQLQDSTLPLQTGKDFEENIIRQMLDKSLVSLQQNRTEIKISLNPPYLGRVYLEFDLDGGKLQGKIFSENQFVKEAVERNIGQLKGIFHEKGMQIDRLEVIMLNPAESLIQFGKNHPFGGNGQHNGFSLDMSSQQRERQRSKEPPGDKPKVRELNRNLIDLFI